MFCPAPEARAIWTIFKLPSNRTQVLMPRKNAKEAAKVWRYVAACLFCNGCSDDRSAQTRPAIDCPWPRDAYQKESEVTNRKQGRSRR